MTTSTATATRKRKPRSVAKAIKEAFAGTCGNPRCGRKLTWQDRAYRSGPLCKNCATKAKRQRLQWGKPATPPRRPTFHHYGATIGGNFHAPAPECKHLPAYRRMFPQQGRKAGKAA